MVKPCTEDDLSTDMLSNAVLHHPEAFLTLLSAWLEAPLDRVSVLQAKKGAVKGRPASCMLPSLLLMAAPSPTSWAAQQSGHWPGWEHR